MSHSKTKHKSRRKSTGNKKRAVYSTEDPTKMFDIIEQLGKGYLLTQLNIFYNTQATIAPMEA